MIVVRLQGGLGNQLFQFAAALALAKRRDTSVAFDFRFLAGTKKETTPRSFELHLFNIPEGTASTIDKLAFGMINIPFISILASITQKIFSAKFYSEQSLLFDPLLFKITGKHIYLKGYFQSERYFKEVKNEILNMLPSVTRTVISEKIKLSNSVSLHIRRGDYASVERINKVHGLLSLQYYYSAVQYMIEQLGNVHVFIFSDDVEWVKENLMLQVDFSYVNNNRDDNTDIILMSLCKHNIIANSSFSWWGAWFNSNPKKIVIAPKRWFLDDEFQNQSHDIVPEGWIRM